MNPALTPFQQINQLPYSEEAEQATLGGLIIDINNEAWDKIADVVTEEDFYYEAHRQIFIAARSLSERYEPIDIITLSQRLDDMHQLEKVGGKAFLARLALGTPTSANIRAYANIVRDFSLFRQMISVGTRIVDRARQPEDLSPIELLDQAETEIFAIAENSENKTEIWQTSKNVIDKTVNHLMKLTDPAERSKMIGAQTEWDDFNAKTNGLQDGDLIIVAGRPSMGKTTFAMNMATHIALNGKPVGVFSIEMGADQLMTRIIASLAKVPLGQIFKGSLNSGQWNNITAAAKLFDDARLFIDESATLSPIDVRSRARRLQRREGKLGLIVIDYLQLMTSGQRTESRVQEVAQISRSLKALAKELDVPVVALSQLSRKNMDRPDKKPILSDLRESGAIEQDADLICFVHRDEMVENNEEKKNKLRGKAEIIIGKHRNGETGTVHLRFRGEYNKFENQVDDYYEEEFTPTA